MTLTKLKFHIIAFFVVVIWGTTFVSTKVLINAGLSPAEIFLYRSILAYIGLVLMSHSRWFADSKKDEWLLALLGVTGGSLFFLVENTSLVYTLTGNVALLVCTTQIFTALIAYWFKKTDRLSPRLFVGAMIVLTGIALVVMNGDNTVEFNLLGDSLALASAVLWAVYQVFIKDLSDKYSALFITRKVFFYGIITILPYFLFAPEELNPHLLEGTAVIGNIVLLGICASMLCFWLWTIVVKEIGAIQSANYLYLNPVVALVASYFLLDEQITWMSMLGAGLILGGVYYSERKQKKKKPQMAFVPTEH